MTVSDPNNTGTPTPDPVTPPPAPDLEAKLAKAEADKQAAEGRLRLLQRDHTTLQAKTDALQAGVSKSEADKIASLRIELSYKSGIPPDLLPLVTGNTEDEIKTQIKIIMDQFASTPAAPAPPAVTPGNEPPATDPNASAATPPVPPRPQPVPVAPGQQSWLEQYRNADLEKRARMDREVQDGKIKPW